MSGKQNKNVHKRNKNEMENPKISKNYRNPKQAKAKLDNEETAKAVTKHVEAGVTRSGCHKNGLLRPTETEQRGKEKQKKNKRGFRNNLIPV